MGIGALDNSAANFGGGERASSVGSTLDVLSDIVSSKLSQTTQQATLAVAGASDTEKIASFVDMYLGCKGGNVRTIA